MTVTFAEQVNRRAWSTPGVLRAYQDDASPRTDWWSDAGERAALLSVASAVRSRPILEIGVGGGRLIPLLTLLSDDYVGIDYTPEMVDICRTAHPDADVRSGDVRNLSDFPSAHYGLVIFTFNGLDAIDHADRLRGLSEISRVLADDGLFVYSTHNRLGPCFRARPWRRAGFPQRGSWPLLYRMGRHAASVLMNPLAQPRALRNWARHYRHLEDQGTWAVAPVEAHDFELMIHYTTLEGVTEELSGAGMQLLHAFDAERGRPIEPGSDTSGVRYFHLIASKAPQG